VFRYFGILSPGSSIKEGEWTVELRCSKEGNCIYRRQSSETGESVEEILGGVDELRLYPDIYGGENVYYLYLDLERELLLAPDSETMITVGVPIAIRVVMIKRFMFRDVSTGKEWVEERKYEVDRIPLSKVTYALYGSPERGILARYYKAKVGSWLILKEAPMEVYIFNNTQRVEKVKRIVFPTLLPKLFFVPGSGKVDVSPIAVEIERGVATIRRLRDTPRKQGYVEVPDTGKVPRWVAIFGL